MNTPEFLDTLKKCIEIYKNDKYTYSIDEHFLIIKDIFYKYMNYKEIKQIVE
ncbi:MAG TPA: hypothetical protein VNF93_02345 [Buchnera sp. (in: enterobacteria)]|nr:hypothetical protein [Buchnera sp. (in: enterobacteria)]